MGRNGCWVALVGLLGLAGCAEDETFGTTEEDYFRELEGLGEPLVFDGACEPGESITLAAAGDVLLHGRLQQQAHASPIGHVSLWEGVVDLLASADVTYANLEGPTAPGVNKHGAAKPDPGPVFDGYIYTSYPMFNYHPSLLDDLIDSGVDVVSTANNHSLDRHALGADRTIDELEERGLAYTGTRRRGDSSTPWYTITETEGFRLAWLACTYGTNGIPDPHDQVLGCYSDRSFVLDQIESLSERSDVDVVIVTPHWGSEYRSYPDDSQVDLGREMLERGALAVIGSHPHVLQPWERYVTADGRETFAIYSLGNFVSGQRQLARRSTLLLYLGLTRAANGRVVLNGARYVPLHMSERGWGLTLEVIDTVGGAAESRANTVDMFNLYNLALPEPPVVGNPQCEPGWQAPHPHDGWIGGRCSSDEVCGGTTCDLELDGGTCTLGCDGLCPDSFGRAGTFCVADPLGNAGICVPKCDSDADCRSGFRCEARDRFGPSNLAATEAVCVPGGLPASG